jgi:hypothetical protein
VKFIIKKNRQDEHHAPQMFAEIDIAGDTDTKKSVPIPPRDRVPKGTGVMVYPQADHAIKTGAQLFADQAARLADKTVTHAVFVPFMAYWPTYGSMTAAQSNWYFYWRGKVRAGEYPVTDLSYVFLYIYELINLVGTASELDAYGKLKDIWRAYGKEFPKLKIYLKEWMTDFALLYELGETDELPQETPARDTTGRDSDKLLLDKFNERPLNFSVELLREIANYDITRSKFYQSLNAQVCDDYAPAAVALVDAYLEKQRGQRIIELYHPGVVQHERYLFRSALYAGTRRTIKVDTVPVSTYPPLRAFLTHVIRHTENKLREIKGYPGRLRGIELDDDLQRLIDAYLERELVKRPEPPTGVVIDADKLRRAAREAEQTQRMLTADRPGLESVDTWEQAETSPVQISALTETHVTQETLYAALDEAEARLVRAFAENGWEADERSLQLLFTDCMIEEVMDRLNEKSLDMLGGLLLVRENGKVLIDEDYREEIASFISKAEQRFTPRTFTQTSGQDEGWLDFFRSLTQKERDILEAVTKKQGYPRLRLIAETAGALLELMLDAINEKAMESIGDIIIEDGAITEEYEAYAAALFHQEDE